MSKDLLAELDTFYQPSSSTTAGPASQAPSFSFFDSRATQAGVQQSKQSYTPSSSFPSSQILHVPGVSSVAQNSSADDDDWGDFENAGKDQAQTLDPQQGQSTSANKAPFVQYGTSNAQPLFDDTSTDEASTVFPSSFAEPIAAASRALQGNKPAKKKANDNVLFDADLEFDDDDDDFGDFEGPGTGAQGATISNTLSTQRPAQVTQLSQNLVDLDFDDVPRQSHLVDPWQAESKVASFRISTPAEPDRFIARPVAGSRPDSRATTNKNNAEHEDEAWDGLDDWLGPSSSKSPAVVKPATQSKAKGRTGSRSPHASKEPSIDHPQSQSITQASAAEDDAWDDFGDAAPERTTSQAGSNPVLNTIPVLLPDPAAPSSLPPTNVPPPSLVFTLFAPMVAEAQKSFFQPLASLPPAKKTEALNHITAQDFVSSYIALGTVAARTIAGRKLRWKRDSRLSQSMRIGAAGGKGMKLTGVDKSELAKEDREVDELVRVWNAQVGKLRAVVAPTNHLISKALGIPLGTVPDLKTVMPVTTAKEGDGAVPSQRPCALCGLKREERLAGLEKGDVGDMFGEWWIEGTNMHRTCRNLWEARSADLRTR